jgi:hypothetical protein
VRTTGVYAAGDERFCRERHPFAPAGAEWAYCIPFSHGWSLPRRSRWPWAKVCRRSAAWPACLSLVMPPAKRGSIYRPGIAHIANNATYAVPVVVGTSFNTEDTERLCILRDRNFRGTEVTEENHAAGRRIASIANNATDALQDDLCASRHGVIGPQPEKR